MMRHIDETRLNDYLDELLSDESARTVRAHLDVCPECSEYLTDLRALVAEMGEMPLEAEPARDLWVGIHARIDGRDADVLELPTGWGWSTGRQATGRKATGRQATGRQVSMSWGQLLAASIALACVSGGVVWTALQTSPSTLPVSGSSFVSPVAAVQNATARYDDAILELEELIQEGRDVLTAETIQTLEQSLASIDQAIEEAQAALSVDPNSGLLNRLLTNHQQAKLRVLQRTVAAMRI